MKFAAALCLALAAAGCAPIQARVARGEAYKTGNRTYDEFFTAVTAVRAESLAGQAEESATRAKLIAALKLEAKAPMSLVLEEAALRATKLRQVGVLLHLELTPEPKLVASRAKPDIGPDGEALLKATEDAAKSSLDVKKRLAAVAARAAELSRRRVELRAQAPAAFREEPQVRRDDIIFELDAADAVLTGAAEGANRNAGAASRFAVELAQAVETGAVVAVAEPPGAAKPKGAAAKKPPPPAVAAAHSPAARAAPAKPAPAAAAPRKKKPKASDDFEP